MLKQISRQGMTGLHVMLFLVVGVLLFRHVCLDLLGYLSALLVGMVIGDSLHRIVTPDMTQHSGTSDKSSENAICLKSVPAIG